MKMYERNVNLNYLKAFACMGVVLIHITFPGQFGQIVLSASAYAVPVFLLIAGYYAYDKDEKTIRRRLTKIVKIFMYAYTLYFAYNILFAIKNHELETWICVNYNWKTPIKYIFFCTIDYAIPLWYLIAMIETYIVWFFVVKKKQEDKAIKMIPLLFVLQIIITSYCETMKLEWFWKVNFITRAMPWFMFGYYLNKNKESKLRKLSNEQLVILSFLGCIIAIMPTTLQLQYKFNIIGYIPYAFGLFSLALNCSLKHNCRFLNFLGDKLSLNIYIFHPLIGSVVNVIYKYIFKVDIESMFFLWCRPIVVLVCSILTAWSTFFIINYIKERMLNKSI